MPAPARAEKPMVVVRDSLSTVVLALSALSAVLLFVGSLAYGQISPRLDFLSTDTRTKVELGISILFAFSVVTAFVAAGLCIRGTYFPEGDDGPPA